MSKPEFNRLSNSDEKWACGACTKSEPIPSENDSYRPINEDANTRNHSLSQLNYRHGVNEKNDVYPNFLPVNTRKHSLDKVKWGDLQSIDDIITLYQ